ncbi:MAG: 30S ribosomal protein S16 [Chloroflexota bacterium]|jgi:small subunit ribosomal protein S16|nr:30S ribosomal protein S16 [Dehalococcoidia bacterium]MDW8046074.1 30S ribosomal protein S16 [Chloroflexota bacterium]
MLKIRLRPTGKKKQHYFRVVVADARAKRDGAFVDLLGSYDPHTDPPTARIDLERAREWIRKGAQPSEAAAKVLRRAGLEEAAKFLKAPAGAAQTGASE